jgi:hypothetical protein
VAGPASVVDEPSSPAVAGSVSVASGAGSAAASDPVVADRSDPTESVAGASPPSSSPDSRADSPDEQAAASSPARTRVDAAYRRR